MLARKLSGASGFSLSHHSSSSLLAVVLAAGLVGENLFALLHPRESAMSAGSVQPSLLFWRLKEQQEQNGSF